MRRSVRAAFCDQIVVTRRHDTGMSRRLFKFSGGSVAVLQRVEDTLALRRCSEYRPSYL